MIVCATTCLMPVVCVLLVLLSNEDNARLLLSVEAGATGIFLVLVVMDKPFACDEGDDHAAFAIGDKAQIVALLCVLVQLSIMLLWLEASGSIPEAVSTGLGLFVLFFPFVYMWRLYHDHDFLKCCWPKTMVRSIVRFRF